MKLIEYPDREILMIDLADKLASELGAALHHEDRVTFVVPGGTTPGPIFDELSAVDLDWARVDLMLGDERWVPESSERSNTRQLRERFLKDHATQTNLIPLYAATDTPEESLDALTGAVDVTLPINVLLLGMGADMHTASLFPGADQLALALTPNAPTLVPMRAPGAPEPRITLSARVLAGAMATHVLITGAEKRAALAQAQKLNDPMQAPILSVLRNATVHWAE